MKDTPKTTDRNTERETIERALRRFLRLRQQKRIRRFRGKLSWEGDLEAMRRDT